MGRGDLHVVALEVVGRRASSSLIGLRNYVEEDCFVGS